MIEKLKETIEQLSESEAKTWLFHTMLRLEQLHNMNVPKDEMMETIQDILQAIDHKPPQRTDFDTLHIAGSESTAGSLRVGLERNHKVIGFWEMFDIGPLGDTKTRHEWLQDHINIYEDSIEEEFGRKFKSAMEELFTIPAQCPVILWTANNAHEQIFHRYILHHLRECENDIYLINASDAYQELESSHLAVSHSGELEPEKMKNILQKNLREPLSTEAINQYVDEWLHLTETPDLLRIWKEGKIQGVPVNYFDQELLYFAKEAQMAYAENGFLKAGRIIGETYGQLEGRLNTAILEYRLRTLAYKGHFEMRGIPKSIRHYSVRWKNIQEDM
ncbi:hypothetical protein AB685_15780 [Bacillus sp. LL01]|uniref:DUF1835 domain-containing protein n=1 Tax=Bacillus sp. LL01 TaxID=1665556 RepID=UPI00064D2383|nr:DUF1835 domain-containing protein [Bacillus sp. LL01]KMJ57473.1 hypothetical protein AB685_15780 [Bacillus sp. LL01]